MRKRLRRAASSASRESFSLTTSPLRFHKFITLQTIESGLWTLIASRQLLNIANIQSRSWFGVHMVASGKTLLVFVEKGLKINEKIYQRKILEAVVLP
ncbi:hypothetical protein TNCV_3263231 [Trichonephila clavipes]|nr:hypothetical protein TNCV_3263231 [Trichonephila clavipes]